jgi:copper chaperone CopZ
VKKSLLDIPGVTNVAVSADDKTAVVTFDDSKTQVDALVKATTNAGYPVMTRRLRSCASRTKRLKSRRLP